MFRSLWKGKVGTTELQLNAASCENSRFFTPRNRFRQHQDSGVACLDDNFQWSDGSCEERPINVTRFGVC
ncbi:MAG: hypothetical protein DMG41_30945 [Acidobacteria bacterium]|nr:MAG: hypothetical protein DMG41_30945 [Acidobacteriota bacterium]